MIYDGLCSEQPALMRMNFAPRSVADQLGTMVDEATMAGSQYSLTDTRSFLKGFSVGEWNRPFPAGSVLSGDGFWRLWEVLAEKSDA